MMIMSLSTTILNNLENKKAATLPPEDGGPPQRVAEEIKQAEYRLV